MEEEEGRELLLKLDNRGTMSLLPVLQRKQPNHCSQTEKCLSAYFYSFCAYLTKKIYVSEVNEY